MRIRDAQSLKPGDKVFNTHRQTTETVKSVIQSPTNKYPHGRYPLIQTKEHPDPTTYLLFRQTQ